MRGEKGKNGEVKLKKKKIKKLQKSVSSKLKSNKKCKIKIDSSEVHKIIRVIVSQILTWQKTGQYNGLKKTAC